MTPTQTHAATSRRRSIVAMAALALTIVSAALALTPRAEAARDLDVGFADFLYGSIDESQRNLWADRTVDANASIIRINVYWRSIAPDKPANPRDPADPAYNWTTIDNAVAERRGARLRRDLTSFAAPDWARGAEPRRRIAIPGHLAPRPGAFGDFAHALAVRYSGTFPAADPSPRSSTSRPGTSPT